MKKITVLMGIYNCESTLPEALDCLLAQTFTEWKCILCDDGSNDNTYNVAKEYVDKYSEHFILIKNEKNSGLNVTLNNCLALADTEYIARMDGDDVCDLTRFEKQISFLKSHPEYDIVSSSMVYFDENGDFRTSKGRGEPSISSFCKASPFCHAPCMMKTEALKSIGGYIVSDKRLRVEDWDMWIRLYAKGYRGYELDEPLYKMRDDRNAYLRRKFKFRINEARVSAFAIKELNLSRINYVWCLRPIIVGLLPKPLYTILHHRRMH